MHRSKNAANVQEAQSILEEVYRAAPVPEEYMKYQLHLSTGMEVPQIELWFQNRRTKDGGSGAPAEGTTVHASCQSAQQWLRELWSSGLQVQREQQLMA